MSDSSNKSILVNPPGPEETDETGFEFCACHGVLWEECPLVLERENLEAGIKSGIFERIPAPRNCHSIVNLSADEYEVDEGGNLIRRKS